MSSHLRQASCLMVVGRQASKEERLIMMGLLHAQEPREENVMLCE